VGISLWETLRDLEASAGTALEARNAAADLGAETIGEPQILEMAFDARPPVSLPATHASTNTLLPQRWQQLPIPSALHRFANQDMASKSVEALLEDIRFMSEERYQIVAAVRAFVKQHFKPFAEEVKYGGILFSSGVQFCGVFAYKEHVSVEFGHGAAIRDKLGHLEGSGKLRRHIKLASVADIESKQLAEYLPLALQAARSAA